MARLTGFGFDPDQSNIWGTVQFGLSPVRLAPVQLAPVRRGDEDFEWANLAKPAPVAKFDR